MTALLPPSPKFPGQPAGSRLFAERWRVRRVPPPDSRPMVDRLLQRLGSATRRCWIRPRAAASARVPPWRRRTSSRRGLGECVDGQRLERRRAADPE
jgi:hypothetical protein